MSVELVLAVIGGADICLKYGKTLIRAYKDFRDANAIVSAKVLMAEAFWSRTALQMEFVKRVAHTMEPEHCRIHIEVFEMLRSKLLLAIMKIESLVATEGGVKKWKLPFARSSLDETISQLEVWQRLFDPTWYLILRIGNKVVDTELFNKHQPPDAARNTELTSKPISSEHSNSSSTLINAQKLRTVLKSKPDTKVHISLPENGLDWQNATSIGHSTCQIVQRVRSSNHYIVDSIDCESGVDVFQVRTDAESLAKRLQQVDHGVFALPNCYGLIKRKNPVTLQLSSISLAFKFPYDEATTPISLRELLMQPRTFSLTQILNLARQLARAVSFIHTCDFVHKNIRPEIILSFPAKFNGNHTLECIYLLGFDSFRSVNFHTTRTGDTAWERNLYRHPSRQGLHAHNKFIMQHDVYSLGVCLLEVGLWESFLKHNNIDGGQPHTEGRYRPSERLGLKMNDFAPKETESLESYSHIKDHLIDLANSKLPISMGDKYAAVVTACLTCLDEGNEDFGNGDDMQDEDGILIGVRFIEKVLFRLSEISF